VTASGKEFSWTILLQKKFVIFILPVFFR